MPSEPVTGIHHVGLVARALSRTTLFYHEVLGLHTRLRTDTDSGDAQVLEVATGPASTAFLTIRIDPHARSGRWGVGGLHHVAMGVDDEAALLRWKRRLTDLGVGVTGPYDRGYFTSLYFQDPDGQILELATSGPGYDVDEPADALGERFIVPPDTRVRGHRDEAAIAARTHPEPVDTVDPGMAILGLHHVTGITDDLDAAHDFHTRVLGLRLVKQTANQDDARTKHLFWAVYDGIAVKPGSSMTLFGWPGSDYTARQGTGQAEYLAYGVAADHEGAGTTLHAPDGLEIRIVAD